MSGHARITGAEVRARLDHPVIDADAHIVESTELVDEYVREIGGPDVFERWSKRPPRYGPTKMIWWGSPSDRTPTPTSSRAPSSSTNTSVRSGGRTSSNVGRSGRRVTVRRR